MPKPFVPRGVMPATLLAFNDDYSINEAETRRHLSQVASIPGVSAIIVNGHASEVHACSFDEQRRLLRIAADEIGDKVPLVAGVYAEGSLHAAEIARMSEAEGASALLVFPPNSIGGGMMRHDMARVHFKTVSDASGLPKVLFQYQVNGPLGYPLPLLLKLLDENPTIVGMKDNASDPQTSDHQFRALQGLSRRVAVLTSHSAWLLGHLSMGADGIISGAGSIIADLQIELFNAVSAGDLKAAQRVADRMYPLNSLFYRHPYIDMHNRMKEGLVLLGRLNKAVVRPPLVKLSTDELANIRLVFERSGLLEAAAA